MYDPCTSPNYQQRLEIHLKETLQQASQEGYSDERLNAFKKGFTAGHNRSFAEERQKYIESAARFILFLEKAQKEKLTLMEYIKEIVRTSIDLPDAVQAMEQLLDSGKSVPSVLDQLGRELDAERQNRC